MNSENRIELSKESLPSSEQVWQNIQEKVQTELEQIGNQIDQPFSAERFQEMLAREAAFVKKIWEKVTLMVEAGKQDLVILFDVDETIGTLNLKRRRGEEQTIIRPSFRPLVENLRSLPIDLKFGLITTRALDYFQEQLNDPEHLQPIAQLFDKRYLFSTEQLPYFQQKLAQGSERQKIIKLAKKAKIVTDDIDATLCKLPITETREEIEERSRLAWEKLFSGDLSKILLLRNLLNPSFQYSDGEDFASPYRFDEDLFDQKAILVVDDFIYPHYLNPEKIQGITLKGPTPESQAIFSLI